MATNVNGYHSLQMEYVCGLSGDKHKWSVCDFIVARQFGGGQAVLSIKDW